MPVRFVDRTRCYSLRQPDAKRVLTDLQASPWEVSIGQLKLEFQSSCEGTLEAPTNRTCV